MKNVITCEIALTFSVNSTKVSGIPCSEANRSALSADRLPTASTSTAGEPDTPASTLLLMSAVETMPHRTASLTPDPRLRSCAATASRG